VNNLLNMSPLGGQRPSDMLAAMLKLCPAGKSTTHFFAYSFLKRLPHEICVLLSDEDPADMQAAAEKADKLITLHSLKQHESVAAVSAASPQDSQSDGEVCAAAVSFKHKKKNFSKFKRGGQQNQQQSSTQPADGLQSSLYFYHAKYGKSTWNCSKPCSWAEN
jgi:hypothetical protein